jgi:hypothetical protein
MVEAQLEGAVDCDRAAKTDAAIHREIGPALEQEAHDLQEILIPADRDAVFGDPAKPRHDLVVEPFDEAHDIADRLEGPAATVLRDAGEVRG